MRPDAGWLAFAVMALAKRKPEFDFAHLRDEMVEHHIAARGVRSTRVLQAMRKIPREAFQIGRASCRERV